MKNQSKALLVLFLLAVSSLDAAGVSDPKRIIRPASIPLPQVGKVFVDPPFSSSIRRVTGDSGHGSYGTQIYSQLQAFSEDNQFVLLIEGDYYTVRRLDNLALVLRNANWNAPRWYPAQNHTLIHFDSNADTTVRLQLTNVDTKTTSTIFSFPKQYRRVFQNQSFDELSRDGRWITGMLQRNDNVEVIFAFDTLARKLGAVLPIPDFYKGACKPDPQWGQIQPDWIAASPLGRYLVVQWERDGTTRCSGLETFNPQSGAFVGRVYDGHQHGDLGIDTDGVTEFFMTVELYHPSGNPAIGLRKLPGNATVTPPRYLRVTNWEVGEHISCRGPNGACLLTNGSGYQNGWNPMEGEIMLLRTNGTVLRLAHHRSSSCGYWVQPRASISRDGRYVIFASDWGVQTGAGSCDSADDLGRGDAYVIDLSR